MDALEKLKSEKAKVLADAQARAEEIEHDMARLLEMEALAAKYGLVVVEKSRVSVTATVMSPSRTYSGTSLRTEGGSAMATTLTTAQPAVAMSRSSPSQQTLAIKAAEEILLDSPEPIKLKELYQRVAARGVRLGGQRPQSTLSAYLSHSKKICSVRKGWWGVMPNSGVEEPF
jgi:hypothetical protein